MVSVNPDTKLDGDWGAGSIYVEPCIRACSPIHDWQLAGVPVLPLVGRINGREGYEAYGGTTPSTDYNGDEDQGRMGGPGVLMAMGLFDVTGGAATEPRYEITSPLFDRVTVTLDPRCYPRRAFTITTSTNVPGNVYFQSASLNGQPITGLRVLSARPGTARIDRPRGRLTRRRGPAGSARVTGPSFPSP